MIVVTIGFTKFAMILTVTIDLFEVNSENQWFCRYYIGIRRLLYEIIDNIFVNLCLENKQMHSIITQVCKKWRRHIDKQFVEKKVVR